MNFQTTQSTDTVGGALNYVANVDIDGHRVISSNIISLVIREWVVDVLPRLECILSDDGCFTECYPLQDNTTITVEFGKLTDANLSKLDFTLLSYTAGSMAGNKFMQIMMTGILKIDGFYKPYNRCFKNKNSFDVLNQMIVSEGKCVINKDSQMATQDLMNWLQINQSNLEMTKHVLKRAYKPNDPVFLYADTTGKFQYTSLNIELAKQTETIAKFDIQKYTYDTFKDNADYQNIFYNSYNIYDFCTYIAQIKNNGVGYKYYNTSTGLSNNKLINNSHPLSDLSAKDKDTSDDLAVLTDFGHQQSKNTHKNYYQAIIQNDFFKNNMMGSFVLELNINSLAKPRLMSKTNVVIPSLIGPDQNHVMSGEYLVIGKVHQIAKVNGIYDLKIACVRNGYNNSPNEVSNLVK